MALRPLPVWRAAGPRPGGSPLHRRL